MAYHHYKQERVPTSASARRIYDKRGGAIKTCATPRPLSKGNISVADCMPLSSLLKTIKTNGGVQSRRCIKIVIVDEYLAQHSDGTRQIVSTDGMVIHKGRSTTHR